MEGEDAPARIASAKAAGASVITIPSTLERSGPDGADVIVDSLDELSADVENGKLRNRWKSHHYHRSSDREASDPN